MNAIQLKSLARKNLTLQTSKCFQANALQNQGFQNSNLLTDDEKVIEINCNFIAKTRLFFKQR